MDQLIEREGLSAQKELRRYRRMIPATIPAGALEPQRGSRTSIARALRICFNTSDATAVSAGFEALRTCRQRIATIEHTDWKPKPPAVQYDIGQVFRHRKHGFRGVVVEWFPTCPMDKTWQELHGPFEKGVEQPFYRTLVDTKDRPNPFVAVAAEENLEPLNDASEAPISHPLLSNIFGGFEEGRHVMLANVQKSFPED